jgi:hypothetical protein
MGIFYMPIYKGRSVAVRILRERKCYDRAASALKISPRRERLLRLGDRRRARLAWHTLTCELPAMSHGSQLLLSSTCCACVGALTLPLAPPGPGIACCAPLQSPPAMKKFFKKRKTFFVHRGGPHFDFSKATDERRHETQNLIRRLST